MDSVKKTFLLLTLSAVSVLAPQIILAAQNTGEQSAVMNEAIDKIIKRENDLLEALRTYSPLVETYIQNLDRDAEKGAVPKSDSYFLGKLDMTTNPTVKSLVQETAGGPRVLKPLQALQQIYAVRFVPEGFANMVTISNGPIDRQHYTFEYARRDFLGQVRCFVFDVKPTAEAPAGSFLGRIWVEDQDYNIVRFNGTFIQRSRKVGSDYVHFDSWRQHMGPGLWLPSYIYSEESDRTKVGKRKLSFKSQTRLWGYNSKPTMTENELTSIKVDALSVRDSSEAAQDVSPVLSARLWERQAEDNVIERMEKAGLLAPEGEVSKVLETVVNNLEVTNNLDIQPRIRCRVLLTSPLESFAVGHTIVLSRGLVDVLPDEASLAMMLAHELGHITLGHQLDTKYAFNDRVNFDDEEAFKRLFMRRDEQEESDADAKATEFLKKSPYKDKLANAGLFLKAVNDRSSQLPSLLRPHLGNRMVSTAKQGSTVLRMPEIMQSAPELELNRLDQIAALPLGGRVKVNPWNNVIEMVKTKPVALISPAEKMPFEVTPIFLNLSRQTAKTTPAAGNSEQVSQGTTK